MFGLTFAINLQGFGWLRCNVPASCHAWIATWCAGVLTRWATSKRKNTMQRRTFWWWISVTVMSPEKKRNMKIMLMMDVNGCAVPKLWKESCSRGHCLCLEEEPISWTSLPREILQRLVPWNLLLHLVVHMLVTASIYHYIPPKSKCARQLNRLNIRQFYTYGHNMVHHPHWVLWEAIQSELVSDECSADLSMVGRSHGTWFHVISRVFPVRFDGSCWYRKCFKTSERHLLRSFTAEMKSIFEEAAKREVFQSLLDVDICWYKHIYIYKPWFCVSCLISESPIFWTILKLQQATPKRVGGDHCRRQVDIEGTGCIDWEQFRSFIHNEHVPWWGIRLVAEIWDCGEIKVYVCRLVRIVWCQPQLIKTTVWTEFQSRILSEAALHFLNNLSHSKHPWSAVRGGYNIYIYIYLYIYIEYIYIHI